MSAYGADYDTPQQPEGAPERQDYPARQTPQMAVSELGGEPCRATRTDYAAYFVDLFEDDPPLLNECALGSLINFDVLQGFDPFGKILNAIKGATCGLIKDKIHDPFISKINSKISEANRWTQATNNQYSSWIDQSARDAAAAIYDPTTRFDKTGTRISSPRVNDSDIPNINQDETEQDSGILPVSPEVTDEDLLNDGGSIAIEDDDPNDGQEIIIFRDDNSTGWQDIYNVYE